MQINVIIFYGYEEARTTFWHEKKHIERHSG